MKPLTYYVYFNAGSCNDGDHVWGVAHFKTRAEAEAWADGWKTAHGDDCSYTILEGRVVGRG